MWMHEEHRPSAGRAVLVFERASLLYDVANAVWLESHTLPEDAEHARHLTADAVQEGNVDRVTRSLALRHAECTEALYPMTKWRLAPEADELRSDRLEEPEQYRIELALPESFSATTLDLLEHLVHEYLVASAVADWLAVTLPDKAEAWRLRAAEAMQGISEAKNLRTGVLRRRGHPF